MISYKIKKIHSFDFVFFLALALMIINYLSINLLRFGDIFLLLSRISIVFLLFLCFLRKPTIRKRELLLLFFAITGQVAGGLNNPVGINIIFIIIFIISLKTFSINYFARLGVFLIFCTILFTLIFIYFGIIENKVDTVAAIESYGPPQDRERSTFGFTNVNAFSALVSSFVFLLLYIWRTSLLIKYLFSAFVLYFFYLATDSRTMLASGLLYLVFILLFKITIRSKNFLRKVSLILLLLPIMLTVFTDLIASKFQLLDILLSFRFSYSAILLGKMTFLNWIAGGLSPGADVTVDNSFTLILSSMGLPFLIFLVVLTYKRLKECILSRNIEVYSFIMAFWFFSFSESSLVRPEMIIGILFWLLVVRSHDRGDSELKHNTFQAIEYSYVQQPLKSHVNSHLKII